MLLVACPREIAAHEVPGDVAVQVLVRPSAGRLEVLVRSPLEAMQEMRIPTYGPDLLDLAAARESGVLRDAAEIWIAENLEIHADGKRLPVLGVEALRVSLPSDRSFQSWDGALAHLRREPLPADTQIPWRQAMLDVWLAAPLLSEHAELAVRPRFERLGLRVTTALRYLAPDGRERVFEVHGDPGLVRLDPRWHHAAVRFVEHGFWHVLGGVDHLLFLACLVIPLRRLRPLVLVVTAFTAAHSATLIASALGAAPDALWFPPLVETLIAVSIVYMAFENILGIGLERRWMIAFAFGLVHGFGFSFALRETLQFAGTHVVTSLLAFNVGVELAQVFVLVLLVPLLAALLRLLRDRERVVVVLLSALVAHTGWHWLAERANALAQYSILPPLPRIVPVAAWPWIALAVMGLAVGPRWLRLRSRRDLSQRASEAKPAIDRLRDSV